MRRIAAVWVALIFAGSSAFAQAAPHLRNRDRELEGRKRLLADLQRARLQFGPFYLLSTIELRNLGLQEEIDVPTREELDDLTATLAAPQKLYFVPSKKFVLSAEVEPAYVWFREREALRTWNYHTRGDIHLIFNRLYVDLYGTRSDETVRDLSEFGRLADRKVRSVGADTELKFSSKTDVVFRASNADIRYSNQADVRADVERLERNETSTWAAFRHKTFPRTTLSVAAQVNRFDFETANNRDGKMHVIYLGGERTGTGARLIEQPIQIRVGYATLDYDDPAEQDYRGLLGTAQVSHALHRHFIVQAAVDRRLEFSVFENNNHYAADRVQIGASYLMTRRLELVSTAEFGFNQYFIASPDPVSFERKKRRDEISFYSVAFRYRLARNSIFGLGVGQYRRDSNFGEFDEDGIRLLVQLSISP